MPTTRLIPRSVDYTDKDFDALYARARNLIRSVFPLWTEESVANFGNILVGLNSHHVDVLGYYLDKWARESRIATAELRRSLLGLVKLIGYSPEAATAATVTERFTLEAAMPDVLTLPAGTIVRTRDITTPIDYQLLAPLVFAVGELEKTATVENSVSHTDQFLSTDLPNQSFRLTATPYLEGSASVEAGDGAYTQVDNFLDSTSTDRHYTITLDAQDRATVNFGNGVNGAIPSGTVEVDYKTGGGVAGTVEADTLVVLPAVHRDASGNRAVIAVTNDEAASPGTDRVSNAQIKQLAPQSLRVLNRVIAREDYEIVAEATSGVARALMLFKDQEAAIDENAGILFIVPTGGGTAPQLLLDEVRSKMETVAGWPDPTHPRPNTLQLAVQAAPYQEITHYVKAYRRTGVTQATMKAEITQALTDFYAVEIPASDLLATWPELAAEMGVTVADGDALVKNPRINFGFYATDADGNATGELPWSDVFNVIRDLDSVRKLDAGANGLLLAGQRADVALGNFTFPALGTLTIVDGDTGQTL